MPGQGAEKAARLLGSGRRGRGRRAGRGGAPALLPGSRRDPRSAQEGTRRVTGRCCLRAAKLPPPGRGAQARPPAPLPAGDPGPPAPQPPPLTSGTASSPPGSGKAPAAPCSIAAPRHAPGSPTRPGSLRTGAAPQPPPQHPAPAAERRLPPGAALPALPGAGPRSRRQVLPGWEGGGGCGSIVLPGERPAAKGRGGNGVNTVTNRFTSPRG